MNERIKKLRKALNLTQQEFADRIRVSRGALAVYETGRNEPIDAVISLICREFNVSEEWLRNGTGDMFVQQTETDELAAAVNRLMAGESTDFKRRLINVLSTLRESDWEVLERFAKGFVRDSSEERGTEPIPSAAAEAEALYENSSGYAQNTTSSASSTTEDTESTGKARPA